MASSDTDICNRALQKLGALRIVDLDEDSRNARACLACFEDLRDSELEDHPWNFSIKRVQLAASATSPVFGKANKFTLPADFIRLAPPDPEENPNDFDWQVEGGYIFTNDSAPLNVRYVYRETDANVMSPLFREALATRMALEMCEEITQSNTKKDSLKDDYERIIRRAKKSNAIQNTAAKPPESIWITARD